MLGLEAEEEGRCEIVNVVDTGSIIAWLLKLSIRKVLCVKVTMKPQKEMPKERENQPRHKKTCKEYQEQISPSQVYQGRPPVF